MHSKQTPESETTVHDTRQTEHADSSPMHVVRGPVAAGYLIVFVFFFGLGTWAALAHVASAAIAPGLVSPDGSRKTIQHLEGGIISEILVDDGDEVEAGDRLLVLQDTQARSVFDVLEGKKRLLEAKIARLMAEQAGKDGVEFPKELLRMAEHSPQLQETIQAQRDLFKARKEIHLGRKAIGQKRIDELNEEVHGLRQQIKNQRKQVEFLDEELNAKKTLLDKGLLSRPDFLRLQRMRAETEGNMAENIAAIARARQKIGETKLQIVNEDAVRLDKIVTELSESQSELDSISEQLHAKRDILSRTVITSPVSGVIVERHFHTTGGVVGPGQPILDIVPRDAKLLIDAQVNPVDIDMVTSGQKARVHFLALSERNLPHINGNVRSVSADSLLDEVSGQRYFLARVEVPPEELEKLGGEKITPGMPAEVFIVTGERTVLQYLMQPISDSLRRSFREK